MAYRTDTSSIRPENALKRAEELVAVGQPLPALQVLFDVLTNRKFKVWSKPLEDIMMKFVDLCVDLKKGKMVKEGLNQYRNICQGVNVASLEMIIKHFLNSAAERARSAQDQAKATLDSITDLEADASPEDIMLSYVTDEGSAQRTDRELVTPWFKFLWEGYRSTLEVLKNNARLEALYALTASRAFTFCLSYRRTAEMRRLCDTLRNHLASLQKVDPSYVVVRGRERPDLTVPETLNIFLETRFEQLKVACDLEMYQEAFRTVEDIQGIFQAAKRAPPPRLMAQYYARMTEIFRKSESHLFHGYALVRMVTVMSRTQQLEDGDRQRLASCVVLAALAVLPFDRNLKAGTLDPEHEIERTARMAALLGYPVEQRRDPRDVISRRALLKEVLSRDYVGQATPEVRAIYELLETPSNPLDLCTRLHPHLEALRAAAPAQGPTLAVPCTLALASYVDGLQEVAVLKMLQQLQQVYSSLRLDRLCAMVPFLSATKLERLLVDATRYGLLKTRIDHRHKTITFGAGVADLSDLRDQLAGLARGLVKAQATGLQGAEGKAAQDRATAVARARASLASEHRAALARKAIIEARKEEHERLAHQLEVEEEARRRDQARLNEQAEQARIEAERRRRELEQMQRELEAREDEETRALLESAKKRGLKIKDGDKVDKKELIKEAAQKQLEEHQQMLQRLARAAKTVDHLERARREVEGPLLEDHYRQRFEAEDVQYRADMQAFIEGHRKAWEESVEKRRKFSDKMAQEAREFAATIIKRRKEQLSVLRAERQKEVAAIKAKRHEERIVKRKKEYLRRMAEEEERKKREEADRKRREEEDERRRAEEAAHAGANKFVPPHLRSRVPPGTEPARAPAATGAADREDRWGKTSAPPPSSRGPSGGAGPAAGPAAGAPSGSSAGASSGGYVPPHLRNKK